MECPKCKYHHEEYTAPVGKLWRNPYQAKGLPRVYDDCNACEGKGVIPQVVLDSVTAFGERHSRERAQEYIAALRWCGDHYSFMCGGLYVGIEVDGHLHT